MDMYGKLMEEMENYYKKSPDNFPSPLTKSYNLLVNYKHHHSLVTTQPSTG